MPSRSTSSVYGRSGGIFPGSSSVQMGSVISDFAHCGEGDDSKRRRLGQLSRPGQEEGRSRRPELDEG